MTTPAGQKVKLVTLRNANRDQVFYKVRIFRRLVVFVSSTELSSAIRAAVGAVLSIYRSERVSPTWLNWGFTLSTLIRLREECSKHCSLLMFPPVSTVGAPTPHLLAHVIQFRHPYEIGTATWLLPKNLAHQQ